jgi:hypothetical protein
MDYKDKYIKYKQKYLNLTGNNIQSGGKFNKKYILIDGTSSSGKTSLCKYFKKLDYKCIISDDYMDEMKQIMYNSVKILPNEYGRAKEKNNLGYHEHAKIMIRDAIESGKAILDVIRQKEIIEIFNEMNLSEELFIIVIYTNLSNLTRNLESRRKEGDYRGLSPFVQFPKRYVETNQDNVNKIDLVNRKDFIKLLKNNLKYEFENEEMLISFANDMFKKMNIDDDLDHWIKLRDEYKCDYLLNTNEKSKNDIYKELDELMCK